MKKFTLIISFLFLFSFIGIQIHWYLKNSGNFMLIIQNQSDFKDSIEVTIKLNEMIMYEGLAKREELFPKVHSFNKFLGNYDIMVKRKDIQYEYRNKLNIFLVTWVVVDAYTDTTNVNIYNIPPLFQ